MTTVTRTYEVKADCAGACHHPSLGNISFEFRAGRVTPRSEQEEIALEDHLVPAGLATVVDEGEGRTFHADSALQPALPPARRTRRAGEVSVGKGEAPGQEDTK